MNSCKFHFSLAQAPAYFHHLMNQVLDNCSFAMTYLDDIIIFSETEEEHLAHMEEIFKRLEAAESHTKYIQLCITKARYKR